MPLFQNEANAVAAWLTSEGIQFQDLVAQVEELADRTFIEWCATFEPTDGKTCEKQRECPESSSSSERVDSYKSPARHKSGDGLRL